MFDGKLWVFQAVAGQNGDILTIGIAPSIAHQFANAGNPRRRRWLAEHAFQRRQIPPRRNNLVVADMIDQAARFVAGVDRQLPRGRIADPNRGSNGFGLGDGCAVDDWRCAAGLKAQHLRLAFALMRGVITLKSQPIGRNIARIANRQRQIIWRIAQRVANFVGGGGLAFEPKRIDRIDQRHRMRVGQRSHHIQRLIEITLHDQQFCAIHQGLRQLAQCNFARWHHHHTFDAGASGIRGGGGAGVAGRGANHRSTARFDRFGYRHHHAAILERAGWIHRFQLQPQFAHPQIRRQTGCMQKGCIAFVQRDNGRGSGDGQQSAIPFEERHITRQSHSLVHRDFLT